MQPPIPPPAAVETAANTEVMVWSASATSAAVLVALAVAITNLVQRQRDRQREAERELARAYSRAKLVFLLDRPVWDVLPADPMGNRAWGIPITNLDDRYLLDVTAEFWTAGGYNGDPQTPNVSAPDLIGPGEKNARIGLDFGQVGDDGTPPVLTHWRIRWEDVEGYAWCFDHYGQTRPERYTGQAPRPYTS